ncbi:CGNR zinc finger protein [Tamaricihabitans halophyticus]|uniref:CGNR zinc finger protein n=1 Tax=Tamaricihabitans halophyticus TaxID=1262583 RepID=A0A4R2QPP8_9PSEU|nr:CGNR zinc finger domain-containing protein [Tamaricihabitans halophyticus]TCP50909.1 CGNR zinc finger protein [Tamaricihabitans halophyticus]
MHFNHYGGSGAELAVWLVNGVEDADELVRRRYLGAERLSRKDQDLLAAWTVRLRAVFAATDTDTRVDLINELLAETASKPYISRHEGKPPHLHYASERDDVLTRACAFTASGLAHLMCEAPDRFGHCGRDGCDVVYVDTSRNGRRRYCSTRCANQTRVAEHRHRQRLSP